MFYRVPRSDIAGKLSRILAFPGFVNSDKTASLKALNLYQHAGTGILDGMLAALS
jgi:hypothetical protein